MVIYCGLSRLSTARGSGTGLVTVGPAKVKACKSILITEGVYSLKVSLKSKSELTAKKKYYSHSCQRVKAVSNSYLSFSAKEHGRARFKPSTPS